MVNLKPELDNWLNNFIDICLLAHLAICIPRYAVGVNVGLEVVPNSCPAIVTFFVFFGRFLYFFYMSCTVWTRIAYACFLNNSKLVFSDITKMYLVTEPYSMPILWLRIFSRITVAWFIQFFGIFLIYPPSSTSKAFMIVYYTHCLLHCASQIFQTDFES